MRTYIVVALRAVIALALIGSLALQGSLIMVWQDLEGTRPEIRIPLVVLLFLGVLALQVIGVCIWRLVTMVRRGTVFSFGAFRYVDIVIGAITIGSVIVVGFAALAAYNNRTSTGAEVAPGLVGLICGIALVGAGVALVVYVMRTLLAQAVALDHRAESLQAELNEVV